jgi:PAS domain S-box-containing protein
MSTELEKLAEITKVLNNRDSTYIIQEKYLTELARIQHFLLKSKDLYSISELIDDLGIFLDPTRVLLYTRDGDSGQLIKEWYNVQEVSVPSMLRSIPLFGHNFFGTNAPLSNGRYLHATFKELPAEIRNKLESEHDSNGSFLALPLFADDVLYALILILENSVEERWPKTRLNFLSTLQTSVSLFIGNWRALNKTIKQVENLTYLFNNSLPCLLDDINGIIKDVNNEMAAILGYNKDELIGKNWDTIVAPEDVEKVKTYHKARYYNPNYAPREYITKFVTATGSELTVKVHTSLLPNGNVYSNIVDLTDCEKTKNILKLAYSAMPVIPSKYVITDINGIVVFCSSEFSKLHGYDVAEIIGTNTRLLKSGKHTPEFYENLWNTIQTGETWKGDITNLTKDKRLITTYTTIEPLFSNTAIIGYIGIKN